MNGERDLYNPDAVAKFEQALSIGCTYQLACDAAGWKYRTYREWMNKAEAGDPKYADLPATVSRARAKRAMRWLASIEKAAAVDWKAAAWKLERLEREEYGREAAMRFPDALKVDLSGSVDLRTLSREELAKIASEG